jgi:transposase
MLETNIRERLRGHQGYRAIQAINGIGQTMAAILVAEIGDVGRFRSAGRVVLLGWSHSQAQRVRHHRASRSAH